VVDGTTIALDEGASGMRWPGPEIETPRSAATPHRLHVILRDGFCGHAVVIAVDRRKVYQRSGVTTDPTILRADALDLAVGAKRIRVLVSVIPGYYAASVDLDVSRHPHLAISLIGEGTVSFEISAHGFS
jgi:hypothetical protein